MLVPLESCGYPDRAVPSLLNVTISDIASGLDRRQVKCVNLVEAYIARTAEVRDDFHPVIQANPDAIAVTKDLDVEIEFRERRGCAFPTCSKIRSKLTLNFITAGRCMAYPSTSKTTWQLTITSMVPLAPWHSLARGRRGKPRLVRVFAKQGL